jgi:PRTRC genetic system protein C
MLISNTLPRIFLHMEHEQEIRLTDPNQNFSVEAVQNFYSGTYPILTTAKIHGPEIKNDEVLYNYHRH